MSAQNFIRQEKWYFWPPAIEQISEAAFDEHCYRIHQGEYSHIVLDERTLFGRGVEELIGRIERLGYPIVIRVWANQVQRLIDTCPKVISRKTFEVIFSDWDKNTENSQGQLAEYGEIRQLTWRVSRSIGLLPVIEKLPERLWPNLRFLFEYKRSHTDEFYSIAEVARILEDLSLRYPTLSIQPPGQYEVTNPALNSGPIGLGVEAPQVRIRQNQQKPIVSYIIPTFNNARRLITVLRNLLDQAQDGVLFEVIVVDDGSSDNTSEEVRKFLKQCSLPFNFLYFYLPRVRARKMGDPQFRAGVARNNGAKWAEGEILCFLDSDILVSEGFTTHLIETHKEFDLVQPSRFQVRRAFSGGRHLAKDLVDPSHLEDNPVGYWERFQQLTMDWNELPFRWRYVSTFCLSIKTRHFKQLGWFKESFAGYGFEDTDLGFRAYRAGLRFRLSREKVFHLKHPLTRSEYFHSPFMKDLLLRRSIQTFYLNNLDREIFLALQIYFESELLKNKWKEKFIGKLRHHFAHRWNENLLGG